MARPLDINVARRIDTWGGLVICAILFALYRLRSAVLGDLRLPPMRATTPPVPGAPPLRPRRILAIKFYGLGNIVMALPVMQALREALPEAEVDFLTMEENLAVLERSGVVTQTIGVSVAGWRAFLGSLWRGFRTIRARRYDLVIDLEQFVKLSTIVACASGARHRIGFNTDGQRRGFLYTIRVVYTDSEHMSRIFMRLLRPLGVTAAPHPVPLQASAREEARVEALLAEHGIAPGRFPVIVVHVGSGHNFYRIPLKRWPTENFAQLCDLLAERYGAAIVLTGKGAEERALVDATRGRMRAPVVDACDRLGIMELVALLGRAHLAVVNDTSVMHLAAAVRTPVVAFFGPTAPLHYGPGNSEDLVFYQDLYCSPCLTNYNLKVSRCVDPVCVRTIGVEGVVAGIDARFLGRHAPLRPALEARGGAFREGRAASC